MTRLALALIAATWTGKPGFEGALTIRARIVLSASLAIDVVELEPGVSVVTAEMSADSFGVSADSRRARWLVLASPAGPRVVAIAAGELVLRAPSTAVVWRIPAEWSRERLASASSAEIVRSATPCTSNN